MNTQLYAALVAAALAIYAMVDLSMRRFPLKIKMVWFPIIILVPLLGPLLYYWRRRAMMQNINQGG